jgi:zinc protease
VSTIGTGWLTPCRTAFDNGVVALAQWNPTSPVVAINATFDAGSAEEPADFPGVAYLVRRTIDRGTANRTASEIADLLDDRGVSIWTSVSRHSFSISLLCLAEDFPDLLRLVADIARAPAFPVEEIEKRRVQAITSLREGQDDPATIAIDLLHQDLYGAAHPYGRNVKGTVAGLEALRRHHLVGYHDRFLVPDALRVAIVGDIEPGRAVDEVAVAFGNWQGAPAALESISPPPASRARSLRRHDMPGKVQADIGYGFTTVRRMDPRFYAFWMMNNVLGQFGLGGRLAENIRERQGMAYYAYSTLEAMIGEGPLIVRAGVDPANVDRAIEAIDDEVGAFGIGGPTRDELEDTRSSLIGSIPRMLESNESIAEFLLHAELFGLGLDFDRRLPELLRAVTIDDVREAAAEVLRPDHAAIVVAGPPAA